LIASIPSDWARNLRQWLPLGGNPSTGSDEVSDVSEGSAVLAIWANAGNFGLAFGYNNTF